MSMTAVSTPVRAWRKAWLQKPTFRLAQMMPLGSGGAVTRTARPRSCSCSRWQSSEPRLSG